MLPGYHAVENQETGEVQYQCDLCGAVRVPGDWPDCRKDGTHRPGTFGEEPLESYVDENVDVEPQEITTRAQRRAFMARNHLEYKPKRTDLIPGRRIFFDMSRGR